MALLQKIMATCAFFGGFALKKVIATMSLLSFMVMVTGGFVFFFFGPYGLVH
jgi:hypothetical protein